MQPFRRQRVLVAAVFLLGSATVLAADDTSGEIEQLRAQIAEQYPGFEVDSIRATPLDGIFEIVSGTDIMYMTGDGKYLLRGSLIDLQAKRNLTAEQHGELVHQVVDALGDDSMLVYQPAQGPAQHTITVFTDTTCPYCRKLHQDLMQMIQRYPVKVRYLMFPRAGLDSGAADELRNVWCADDPQAALTTAKSGGSVPTRDDSCTTPIREHWQVAHDIGVNGTPYLLLDDDGPVFSGYRPAHQLLTMLGIKPRDAAEKTSEQSSGS